MVSELISSVLGSVADKAAVLKAWKAAAYLQERHLRERGQRRLQCQRSAGRQQVRSDLSWT